MRTLLILRSSRRPTWPRASARRWRGLLLRGECSPRVDDRATRSAPKRFNRLPNVRHRTRQIAHHELRLQAEHVKPAHAKLLIAPRVSAAPVLVRAAVDFH